MEKSNGALKVHLRHRQELVMDLSQRIDSLLQLKIVLRQLSL